MQRAGLRYLFSHFLRRLLERRRPVEVFMSGYLGITEPDALEQLLSLSRTYPSLTVRFNPGDRFHAKFIHLSRPAGTYCLFLGSSNISAAGLAGLGELNAQIVGTRRDAVGRSIGIVVDNLRRDRTFRPLTRDLIDEYRESLDRRHSRRRQPRRGAGAASKLPPTEWMPVCAFRRRFTEPEKKEIRTAHPRWKWFCEWFGPLRRLDRGQHFLAVTAVGRVSTFTVGRYLEHDGIPGVDAVVVHARRGRQYPLAELADKLGISQASLVKAKRLDLYGVAILRRAFPKAFG